MQRLARQGLWMLLVGLAAGASDVHADASQSLANQRNMLPGGRAALLGGAFTAVASDSSASFYNPAGLALIKDNRFDLSATSYRASRLTYHEAINDKPFNELSEVTYPSFVGATMKFGSFALGYSYMTLDAHNIYQQDKYTGISTAPGATNTYSRTYQERSTYIYGGVSASVQLSDSLAAGVSAFYYQRNLEYSTHELVMLNGGGVVTINSTMQTLNTGGAAVYGLLWRRPSYSLGASVRTSRSLSDRSVMLSDSVEFDPGDTTAATSSVRDNAYELNELNPATYTFGGALHPWKRFLLSADVLVHEGVKSPHKDRGGADLQTTVNASLGLSVGAGPVELMGGYFSNFSMFPRPDPDTVDQPISIDYVGHSGGLGLDFGNFDGYFGAVRQIGHGQAQIRNDDAAVQNVDGEATTYIIAGNLVI